MRYIVLAFLLVLSTPLAAAALAVSAEAVPRAALPGIPVRLLLTVQNTAEVPQTLPNLLVIQATPATGEPFLAASSPDFVVREFPEEYAEARTLKPGERRVFEVPLSTSLSAGPMGDARLWRPGEFRLQAIFHDSLRADDLHRFGVGGLLAAGRIKTPPVVSSPAAVRIEQPLGVDAEIWQTIVTRTNGRGLGLIGDDVADAIANELWKRAPASAYAPYLVVYMARTPKEQVRTVWQQVIERDPNHPVAEGIRVGNAQMKALEAQAALTRGGNLQHVIEQTEEARNELSTLQYQARQELIRVRAGKALAKVKTAEELTELHRRYAQRK